MSKGRPPEAGFSGTVRKFIQPHHWVIHHELFDAKPQTMVLYMRLRTAQYEGDETVRVMTREQICEVTGLPFGTVKNLLPMLDKAGLLVRTNKDRKNAVPTYAFVDDIPDGYAGITDGIKLREAVLKGDVTRSDYKGNLDKLGSLAEDPPGPGKDAKGAESGKSGSSVEAPPSSTEDPGSLAEDPPSSTEAPQGGVSAGRRDPAATLETLPQEAFKNAETSSSESARARESAPAGREEDPADASNPSPVHVESSTPPAPSPEALRATEGLRVKEEGTQVAVQIERALVLGYPVERVRAALRDRLGPNVVRPGVIARMVVDESFSVPHDPWNPRPDVNRCECDQRVWDEDHLGSGKCDHARLLDCPDCRGSGYRRDKRRCGHPNSPSVTRRWPASRAA